jgi:hypothetical protein
MRMYFSGQLSALVHHWTLGSVVGPIGPWLRGVGPVALDRGVERVRFGLAFLFVFAFCSLVLLLLAFSFYKIQFNSKSATPGSNAKTYYYYYYYYYYECYYYCLHYYLWCVCDLKPFARAHRSRNKPKTIIKIELNCIERKMPKSATPDCRKRNPNKMRGQ